MRLKIISIKHLNSIRGLTNRCIITRIIKDGDIGDYNIGVCTCSICMEDRILELTKYINEGCLYTTDDRYTAHDLMEAEREYGNETKDT